MSSPPALSPPAPGPYNSHKRRISLPVHQQGLSQKKPKITTSASFSGTSSPTNPTVASRKNSVISQTQTQHPLRQTSFPPQQPPPADDEDDEDAGRDDYGTETVLADGGTGGFQEDDEEKRKLAILLEAFDSTQNSRYESFRRANLNKAAVKKLANQVLSQSVTQNVGTVICGFSKVFTGEIIELALEIQRSWGDEGPLLPDHLREAARRYRVEMQGAVGFRGAVGGGNPVATGGGVGKGEAVAGGVGRLFR